MWSGTIGFGLVTVGVKMYRAIAEHDLELHFVHEKDGSRIGYEKVCKKEGKPVPADEIVKAYRTRGDKLVYLSDDDFEAAAQKGYHSMDVLDFVPYEQIDPIAFDRSYYLGPAEGAQKAYAVLVRAMQRSGLAGIVRYVFHDRDQLGCLRVVDKVLVLENMHFADEIRPRNGIAPRLPRVSPRELQLAESLIDGFASDFDHAKYKDAYRRRLQEIVRRKQRGEEIHAPARERKEEAPDLLDALRASVEAAKGGSARRSKARPSAAGANGDGMAELTLEELRERAADLGVRGRSQMRKQELVRAIRKAA
jgi:DNA end-binding protein Ku